MGTHVTVGKQADTELICDTALLIKLQLFSEMFLIKFHYQVRADTLGML